MNLIKYKNFVMIIIIIRLNTFHRIGYLPTATKSCASLHTYNSNKHWNNYYYFNNDKIYHININFKKIDVYRRFSIIDNYIYRLHRTKPFRLKQDQDGLRMIMNKIKTFLLCTLRNSYLHQLPYLPNELVILITQYYFFYLLEDTNAK